MSDQTAIPFAGDNALNQWGNTPTELKPLFDKFNTLYLDIHRRYKVSPDDFKRETAAGGIDMSENSLNNYRRVAYTDQAELEKISKAGVSWVPANNRTVRIKIDRLQAMERALYAKHLAGANTLRTQEELKSYLPPINPIPAKYEQALKNSVARKGALQSVKMSDAIKAEELAAESVIRTPTSAKAKVANDPTPNAWRLTSGDSVLQVLGKPGSYAVIHLPDGSFVVSTSA